MMPTGPKCGGHGQKGRTKRLRRISPEVLTVLYRWPVHEVLVIQHGKRVEINGNTMDNKMNKAVCEIDDRV